MNLFELHWHRPKGSQPASKVVTAGQFECKDDLIISLWRDCHSDAPDTYDIYTSGTEFMSPLPVKPVHYEKLEPIMAQAVFNWLLDGRRDELS